MGTSRFFTAVMGAIAALTSARYVKASYYGNEQDGSCIIDPGTPYPFVFPLDYNFLYTTPGSVNETNIAKEAQGLRPNGQFPNEISRDTVLSLQVAAFSYLYGIFYTDTLVKNIIANEPGWYIPDAASRDYNIAALEAFRAQDEQHVLSINSILEVCGIPRVQPCRYYLPATVKDYSSGIFRAGLQSEFFNGFLQIVIELVGRAGDLQRIIQPFTAALQNVGERTGWLWSVNGQPPSANPFPPPIPREYEYALILAVIVPGSCPNTDNFGLPTYPPLNIIQAPESCTDINQVIELSCPGVDPHAFPGYALAYISQQNQPVLVPVYNVYGSDGCVTFSAVFPCELETFGYGLTIAALVQNGTYTDVLQLPAGTVCGPALVYLD